MRSSNDSNKGFLLLCAAMFLALVIVFAAGMFINRGPTVYERIVIQTVDVPYIVYRDKIIIATVESRTVIENVEVVTPYGFGWTPTPTPTVLSIPTSEPT